MDDLIYEGDDEMRAGVCGYAGHDWQKLMEGDTCETCVVCGAQKEAD